MLPVVVQLGCGSSLVLHKVIHSPWVAQSNIPTTYAKKVRARRFVLWQCRPRVLVCVSLGFINVSRKLTNRRTMWCKNQVHGAKSEVCESCSARIMHLVQFTTTYVSLS